MQVFPICKVRTQQEMEKSGTAACCPHKGYKACVADVGAHHKISYVCERLQIPHPPEEGFFLGSAFKLIRKDHHRAFSNWGRQLGPIYAVRVLCWHVGFPPFTVSPVSP